MRASIVDWRKGLSPAAIPPHVDWFVRFFYSRSRSEPRHPAVHTASFNGPTPSGPVLIARTRSNPPRAERSDKPRSNAGSLSRRMGANVFRGRLSGGKSREVGGLT